MAFMLHNYFEIEIFQFLHEDSFFLKLSQGSLFMASKALLQKKTDMRTII